MKIGRNDPCPCGSGKKYKKCCLGKLTSCLDKPIMNKWECYIEEYNSAYGLAARLLDKKTGKKISIQGKTQKDKLALIKFLSAAKIHINYMPTVFSKDGDDIVVVSGIMQREDANTIYVDVEKPGGGYWFE